MTQLTSRDSKRYRQPEVMFLSRQLKEDLFNVATMARREFQAISGQLQRAVLLSDGGLDASGTVQISEATRRDLVSRVLPALRVTPLQYVDYTEVPGFLLMLNSLTSHFKVRKD